MHFDFYFLAAVHQERGIATSQLNTYFSLLHPQTFLDGRTPTSLVLHFTVHAKLSKQPHADPRQGRIAMTDG